MAQSADPDPFLLAQAVELSDINKLVRGGGFGTSFSPEDLLASGHCLHLPRDQLSATDQGV